MFELQLTHQCFHTPRSIVDMPTTSYRSRSTLLATPAHQMARMLQWTPCDLPVCLRTANFMMKFSANRVSACLYSHVPVDDTRAYSYFLFPSAPSYCSVLSIKSLIFYFFSFLFLDWNMIWIGEVHIVECCLRLHMHYSAPTPNHPHSSRTPCLQSESHPE